jgi:hypothetical protein
MTEWGWKSGDPWAQCDVCDFKYRKSQLKKRWDGKMACPSDFEERQPQDFVRAPRDVEAVRDARPPQPDAYSAYSPAILDHNNEPIRDGIGFGDGAMIFDA